MACRCRVLSRFAPAKQMDRPFRKELAPGARGAGSFKDKTVRRITEITQYIVLSD